MKISDLIRALDPIAKEHPDAEIVMSDGETILDLVDRPIGWSDFT